MEAKLQQLSCITNFFSLRGECWTILVLRCSTCWSSTVSARFASGHSLYVETKTAFCTLALLNPRGLVAAMCVSVCFFLLVLVSICVCVCVCAYKSEGTSSVDS